MIINNHLLFKNILLQPLKLILLSWTHRNSANDKLPIWRIENKIKVRNYLQQINWSFTSSSIEMILVADWREQPQQQYFMILS